MKKFKSKIITEKQAVEITKHKDFISFNYMEIDEDYGQYEKTTILPEILPKDGRFIRVVTLNDWFVIRIK